MQHTFLAARIDDWSRERPLLLDSIAAGLIWLAFGLAGATFTGAVGLAVATATIAPLAVRRRFPIAVLAWSTAIFVIQLVVVTIPLPANIAQAIVVYTVAAHVASLPVRLVALAVTFAGCLAGGFRWSTPPAYVRNALVTGVFLAVFAALLWIIGNLVRGRAANMRALQEAYVQRERVTAAREIHDIVAHSLTVVVVQADGAEYAARHATPWDRADAEAALATIGRTARTALSEVRTVISMLRDPDPPDEHVGLAEMRHLIGSVRAAGLPVDADIDPAVFDEVPAAARLALLRVARESLTNVLKHAGPDATAHVTVRRTRNAVTIRVSDDGTGNRASTAERDDTTGNRASTAERDDTTGNRASTAEGDDGMPEQDTATAGDSRSHRPTPARGGNDLDDTPTPTARTAGVTADDNPGYDAAGGRVSVAGGGHGLDGMRERLGALGGTLVAGPGPGRGFTVEAAIPVGAA